MLDRLAATDFAPLVGSAFAAGELALELVEVNPLRDSSAGAAGRRPFALVFRARTAEPLSQGIFSLEHDRLGRLDVFLVPVGRDPGGLLLEAIFT